MTISDLKLEILKKIESLENSQLEEFHGYVLNFLNTQIDEEDWNMSDEQKSGILSAISEIEQGKVVSHKILMEKARAKISNA